MRVQFQMSGGVAFFPGLAKPTTIDVGALDEATQRELGELVRNADFFGLAPELSAPRGAADYRTYTITIEDDGRSHTVRTTDASAPPSLQALIGRLNALAMAPRAKHS